MESQSDEQKTESARTRLRSFIREAVKDQSVIRLPDLTNKAVKFAIKDKAYLKALLIELLRPIVYAEAQEVLGQSRAKERVGKNKLIQMGDGVTSRESVRNSSNVMSRKWLEFKEHAGDRHILLMDMTADDLALAESERRKRADVDYGYANLWARLRTRLEDGQRVRDVWTPEEIDAERRSLRAA